MAEVKEIMNFLGLSRKAGKLQIGHDSVIESIVKDKSELLILASDASEKLKNEIIQKEKDNYAEIVELLNNIERGESTIESLEEKLMQKEKNRQKMEILIRKLEKDSEANATTIGVMYAKELPKYTGDFPFVHKI